MQAMQQCLFGHATSTRTVLGRTCGVLHLARLQLVVLVQVVLAEVGTVTATLLSCLQKKSRACVDACTDIAQV